MESINRGDICLVDFGTTNGCVQGGLRPAIVIQNNIGNHFSPTILVVPLTSRLNKSNLPTHVFIPSGNGGLKTNSLALAEQIQTVNKTQISKIIGYLNSILINKIEHAIKVSLAL